MRWTKRNRNSVNGVVATSAIMFMLTIVLRRLGLSPCQATPIFLVTGMAIAWASRRRPPTGQ